MTAYRNYLLQQYEELMDTCTDNNVMIASYIRRVLIPKLDEMERKKWEKMFKKDKHDHPRSPRYL